MKATELKNEVLERLGYRGAAGLHSPSPWFGRAIEGVQEIYAPDDIPLAYFATAVDEHDEERVCRAAWSQSQARLLVVSRPEIVRIHNVVKPPLDESRRLRGALAAVTSSELRRTPGPPSSLQPFDRRQLDGGSLWEQPDYDIAHRATSRLLARVSAVRALLQPARDTEPALNDEHCFALLSRALFIRYLGDRRSLPASMVWQLSGGRFETFEEAVREVDQRRLSVRDLYGFFDELSLRFNGSMFPVTDEERAAVVPQHIAHLRELVDREGEQFLLWPIDFSYLPLGFMSGLYDRFLETATQRQSGAYFTRLPLVDFVLRETMPRGECRSDWRILDPACGSGAFVVQAYSRLLAAWCDENRSVAPTFDAMRRILRNGVRGVDTNPDALHITAFSMYVTMLEHLGGDALADPAFKFPPLRGEENEPAVLLKGSFSDERLLAELGQTPFDRVLGNPPWGKGGADTAMLKWATDNGWHWEQGHKAQYFLARSLELCDPESGEVALLQPAVASLLNTGGRKSFRETLLRRHQVRAIADFTNLRRTLNPGTQSAIAAFFVRPRRAIGSRAVLYACPKVDREFKHQSVPVVSPSDVRWLSQRDYEQQPGMWCAMRWGSALDWRLVKRLSERLPCLGDLAKRRRRVVTEERADPGDQAWNAGEGMNPKGERRPPARARGLFTGHFCPWSTVYDDREPLGEGPWLESHNARVGHRGPLALLHRTPKQVDYLPDGQHRCMAAYFVSAPAYRHSFVGIPGGARDEKALLWFTGVYNSSLTAYWLFHQSPRWSSGHSAVNTEDVLGLRTLDYDPASAAQREVVDLVERLASLAVPRQHLVDGHRHLAESGNLSVTEAERPLRLAIRHDVNRSEMAGLQSRLDDLIMATHGLYPAEITLVRETTEYLIPMFHWGDSTRRTLRDTTPAIERPEAGILQDYALAFRRATSHLLDLGGMTLRASAFCGPAPLCVVGFERCRREVSNEVAVIEGDAETEALLEMLNEQLTAGGGYSLYYRRHMDLYDGDHLYIVRPARVRFWTLGAAMSDAAKAMAAWASEGGSD
ncbi:MAG: N-6 DNA methylase [Armatimonadetes bacterium]|nr:N-6 DNA methylase [Armatimonadota bacterium]